MQAKIDIALDSYGEEYEVRRKLQDRNRTTVYEVVVDGTRAVCKLSGDRSSLWKEAAVCRHVRDRTTVHVPEVLAAGDGWLLVEWCGGERYDSDAPNDSRRRRLQAVGRTLARLHEETSDWFSAHGALSVPDRTDTSPMQVSDRGRWIDRFQAFVDEGAARLAGTPDADVGNAVRDALGNHREAFDWFDPVLVHGEMSPEHVRFREDSVACVVDWEIARAAPGEFDLVRAELEWFEAPFGGEDDENLRSALVEGYESVRQLRSAFTVRRELYRAAFTMRFLDGVDTAAGRSGMETETLRTAMRAYVIDRIDDARSAPT